MRRITIMVPDELNALVQQERRRRDVSAATDIRDALEAYFRMNDHSKRLSFIVISASSFTDTSERFDEIPAEEWVRAGGR